jgi:hypothetical protein
LREKVTIRAYWYNVIQFAAGQPAIHRVGPISMNEREIFLAALEKDDPAERAAYLDRACGADQALRQRVDRLLAADVVVGRLIC